MIIKPEWWDTYVYFDKDNGWTISSKAPDEVKREFDAILKGDVID